MSDTFSGHDLETGVLQRVRRWRDALPVLVLGDALRVAGSPLYVGLSLITVLITGGILRSLDGPAHRPAETAGHGFADGGGFPVLLNPSLDSVASMSDFRWLGGGQATDWLRLLIVILLWALPAATLARAGGCYAAGREQSFQQNLAVALKRLHWVGLIAVLPVVGSLALSLVMVVIGLVARAGRAGEWLSELGAVLAVPVMIVVGLLAAGAFAAVPLAWAAMVIEKRCDTLDSLSRGYEYLYRRPVQLLFYSVCSYLLIAMVYLLARAVASAALGLGLRAASLGAGREQLPGSFVWLIGHLPLAAALAAFWGLVGAIYLLMRQTANGQELEDIAVSPVDRRHVEMPTLQTSAADTGP